MQALFEAIAGSPTLQALSILITFGGFLVFIFKLLVPAVKFIRNAISDGVRKAYIRSIRPILKRVRRDSLQGYLVVTSTARFMFQAIMGLLILPTFMIVVEATIRRLEEMGLADKPTPDWTVLELLGSLLISVPLGFALSWLLLYPSIKFYLYCTFMRRHVLRRLRSQGAVQDSDTSQQDGTST